MGGHLIHGYSSQAIDDISQETRATKTFQAFQPHPPALERKPIFPARRILEGVSITLRQFWKVSQDGAGLDLLHIKVVGFSLGISGLHDRAFAWQLREPC